jgi:DNA-binding transcriptional LysR family regulator
MKSAAYKDITLQQLRSFCATARHGSLTAAATALKLAHPTVWKQVHALEQTFGTKLVEPHARGCRLTQAGEVLRGLTEPSVANLGLGDLQARFAEALGRTNVHITVAGPPRLLADDLPPCLAAFVPRWPRARFTLREVNGDEVADLVEEGACALGFTAHVENRAEYPQLLFEPWYQLEVILITPRDHPLARQKRVRPEDLRPYPLVDSRTTLRGTPAHEVLVELGLYETEPRWVEARHAAVVYRCVEEGLGIALVCALWPPQSYPTLHQRAMSRYFGRSTVYLVRQAGVHQHEAVNAFAEEVRARLTLRRKGNR